MSKPKHIQKADYVYSEVVSLFKNHARDSKSVLEVGCGTGNNLVFFAENGCHTYGIDVDRRVLLYAKKLLKKKCLTAQLKLADASKIPYKNGMFDLVLDRACIQHNKISSVKKIIKEIVRVLKPGGIFIIVHFRSDKDYAAKNHKLDKTFEYYDDVSFVSALQLKNLLNDFDIIYMEHQKQEVLVPKRYNRCHYIVVGRKK